jgi:UV DNA damage endonuclease
VGGTYGDKAATLARFADAVATRLSPNCRARLTVENDDRPSLYS